MEFRDLKMVHLSPGRGGPVFALLRKGLSSVQHGIDLHTAAHNLGMGNNWYGEAFSVFWIANQNDCKITRDRSGCEIHADRLLDVWGSLWAQAFL